MLKRFRSSTDPGFSEALLIYVRNTPPEIRTESNEITSWLDNTPSSFEGQFYVFGFYAGRQLVGYAEAAYLSKERVFAVDYITIDPQYRRNNVFFEFVDHLRRYLEGEHPEYRYFLAEIGYGPDPRMPSNESRLLIRLLKIQGFHVVCAPYYQPRLMLNNAESETRADLLLLSPAPVDRIQRETFLGLVRELYYSYYLPWKTIPGQPPAKEYKRHLDDLFARISSELGRKRIITVNGHGITLSAPHAVEVAPSHRATLSFAGQSLAIVSISAVAVAGMAHFYAHVDFERVFALCMIGFLTGAAIISPDARGLLIELARIAKSASGRKASGSKPTVTRKEQTALPGPEMPRKRRSEHDE